MARNSAAYIYFRNPAEDVLRKVKDLQGLINNNKWENKESHLSRMLILLSNMFKVMFSFIEIAFGTYFNTLYSIALAFCVL